MRSGSSGIVQALIVFELCIDSSPDFGFCFIFP
jgi:hypothetical protein